MADCSHAAAKHEGDGHVEHEVRDTLLEVEVGAGVGLQGPGFRMTSGSRV